MTGERPRPHADEVARDESLRPLFDAIESSFAWTTEVLRSSGWLQFLAGLPTNQRLVLSDGTTLLGVHASPRSDDAPESRRTRPTTSCARSSTTRRAGS